MANSSSYSDYLSFSTSWYYYYDEVFLPVWSVSCIIGLISLVTIAGNLLVILAYMRDRMIRQTAAYTIILNLAIVDILVGIVILPLTIVFTIYDGWIFGRIACKLWLVADYVLFTMSTFTVVFISLDRYWLVTKGLGYQKFQTRRLVLSVLFLAWSVAISYHMFFAFVVPEISSIEYDFFPGDCNLEVDETVWFNISELIMKFAIPFSALIVLNASVYHNIRQRSKGLVSTERKLDLSTERTFDDTATEEVNLSDDETDKDAHEPIPKHNSNIGSLELAEKQGEVADAQVTVADPANKTEDVSGNTMSTEGNKTPVQITNALPSARRLQSLFKSSSFPKTGTGVKGGKATKNQKEKYKREKNEFKKYRKAAITLGVIVMVYCFCFLPYLIYAIVASFCEECWHYKSWEVVIHLVWCKSTVNPLLYGLTNLLFRRNFVKILKIEKCTRGNSVSP